jgi:hypothetical protein
VQRDAIDVCGELRRRKRNLRYDELLGLMASASCRRVDTGDGCRITHPAVRTFVAIVARPHRKHAEPFVRFPYVNNCIRLLERVLETQGVNHEEEPS